MADRIYLLSTLNSANRCALKCIEDIQLDIGSSEFGFKIQAVAAHVLLRLGFQVNAVNHSGHPDIAASKVQVEYRFEVEAQVGRPRLRQLSDDDFNCLIGHPNTVGFYALAINFPTPYWVLVPASRLVHRSRPSSNVMLESLRDVRFSTEWTREYTRLLNCFCREIKLRSSTRLGVTAIAGRGY